MNEELYNLLKKDIQNKFEKNILYGKDCAQLSKQINAELRRQISASTIKRFFGIIKTNFNPSKYTLDSFAQYIGFDSWLNYINSFHENQDSLSDSDPWENLKNRILLVTNHSLNSLKQKTGYNPEKTIFRAFTKEKFRKFIASKRTATLIVAPDGYGKSTLLIQLVEHYFLNEKAKYKNDIVALIDGGIFFNLYSKNTNIDLLNQILDFKINSSLGFYFMNHPEERKGRIWIIIDSVDEIYFEKEKYHNLVENIMRIIMANEHEWYKIILTCRPENLHAFIHLTEKSSVLNNSWFDLKYDHTDMTKTTNVPLFNTNEINEILKKNRFNFTDQNLNTTNNNFTNIINHPYFLSLYIEEFSKSQTPFSEFILLEQYIRKRIHSLPYQEEKVEIIEKFIELCELGKETNAVRKKLLLQKTGNNIAYRELISFGILYEYIIPHQLVENNTYVKFNHNIIFEFILFEKWKTNKEINTELYFQIRDFYKNNIHLQCNILKIFTQFLIYNNNVNTINQLLIEFDKTGQPFTSSKKKPPCLIIFITLIRKAIQTNQLFYEKLLPLISESKFIKILKI